MRSLVCTLAALCFLSTPALAQGPEADWRTLTTPHYRVHYPAPTEAWTLHLAARLEAIRERVVAEVGWAPEQIVDIVVADPVAAANGQAIPLLDTPRMVLWTSPPEPASTIGNFADWAEDLVVHEDLHLVHLLRPSRNPWRRFLQRLLPVGPLSLRAPRWVHEGYATYVEGRLTGRGRPNSDLRASILRRWAVAGRLPAYGALAQDWESYLGMSMAYLVGSSYLEWLVDRSGPESLRHLWARLSAHTNRDFDTAFEGVFGESPARLYDRFTAELTWRAMEVERQLAPTRQEGELWQELGWTTGAPAVSPDGAKVAIVRQRKGQASRIVVWSTAPDAEAEKRWEEKRDELLARDPEDVAPVRTRPLAREPLFELVTRNGAEPSSLRFLPDGKALLFERFEPDGAGFLHPDLFLWRFETGEVRRLTTLADVRAADPGPDGTWAVGVRHRHGSSQLVRVELATGAVTELTPPSVTEIWAEPRVRPDGRTIAALRHREGRWRPLLLALDGGEERELPVPADAYPSHLAWLPDGRSLLASLGQDGLIGLARLDVEGSAPPEPVTRSTAAALAPAPTNDGRVFFLALEPHGLDLRLAALEPLAPLPPEAVEAVFAPAVRPVPPADLGPLRLDPVSPGRAYGLGRQELRVMAGGLFSSAERSLELGLHTTDVVGRFSTLALGTYGGDEGANGGMLAAAWRGSPVAMSLHLFSLESQPSRYRDAPAALGEALDARESGAELRLGWDRAWRATQLATALALAADRVSPETGRSFDRRVSSLAVAFERQPSRRPWQLVERFDAAFDAGTSDGSSWRRFGGEVGLGAYYQGNHGLEIAWQRQTVRGSPSPFDRLRLGGADGSLVPDTQRGRRLEAPALPTALLVGDDHEGQRATLALGGIPFFFERHRVWSAGGERGDWLRLAGFELELLSGPIPLVRIPGLRLRVGAARVFDQPLKDTNRFWLFLAYRP